MIIRLSLPRLLATSVLVLMVATLLASSAGHAFSLGEMKLQSALGQPLRMSIPIVNLRDEEIGNECFRMRPPASSADGLPTLVTARVSLERAASGDRLLITTRAPVNEPVVQLAVLAQCKLSLQREYTILLDPPATVGTGTAVAASDEENTPTPVPRGRASAGSRQDVAASSTSKPPARARVVAQHDVGDSGSSPRVNRANAAAPTPVHSLQLASSPASAATIASHAVTPMTAPESIAPAGATDSAAGYGGAGTRARPGRSPSPKTAAAPALMAATATTIEASQRVAEVSATALVAPTMAAARILPISTAGAAPIAARSTSVASAFSAGQAPEPTLWETAWPAAASFAAGGMMVLGGLALRRRQLARAAPHWSSTAKATMPGGAPATDLDTFASFAAVTELNFGAAAGSSQTFDRHEPSMETASLDTLLGDLDEDAVEERALREAWAAAQTGIENDPGSSGAILKAINDAERDLAVTDIAFTLDEIEVNLDDHIIPDNDSFMQPMRKTA